MVTSRYRLRFNVFWRSVFFKIVAICVITRIMTCDAQNPEGFLSIDCGSKSAAFKDSETGLIWEGDGRYTLTGMNGLISDPINQNLSNREALRTFRYFPENRTKHCYELPMTKKNNSVLIRATFLQGSSSQLKPPIKFSVYVDSSLWFPLQYDNLNLTAPPDIWEGIFFSPGRTIMHFCLVPETGIPFISSLETRILDSEGLMTSLTENERRTLFFTTLRRWSASISAGSPAIRYPDDKYDRFWTAPSDVSGVLGWVDTETVPSSKLNTSAAVNYVPSEVMLNTWSPNDDGADSYIITLTVDLPENTAGTPLNGRYVYGTLYFAPPDKTYGQNMTIQWNSDDSLRFPVNPNISIKSFKHEPISTSSIVLEIESPDPSYPVLNAIEMYEENLVDQLATDTDNVNAVNVMKKYLNLTDWQGDPCLPVPYSWLTCDITGTFDVNNLNTVVVQSITLSNVENTSSLSDKGVSGIFGWPLTSISVTNSDVDDDTFQVISNSSFAVKDLDFTSNKLTQLPQTLSSYVVSLNLSQNLLKGGLFLSQDTDNSLEYLNLSHNALTSPSSNKSMNFSKLVVLDLSHNRLSSQYLLHNLVQQNNLTLQRMNVSNNSLTGNFSSDLYMSSLRNMRTLDFSGNSIDGKLDLAHWHSALQSVRSRNDSDISSISNLCLLVNNKIEDISPHAEDFDTLIDTLIHIKGFNETGFLLAGNPYCKDAKSLTQLFLCRSTVHDVVHLYDKTKKKKNVILIVFTTLGGVFLFFFSVFIFILVWRLWQQLSITAKLLQEVQHELANRKVQPLFYSYQDLRVATRGFHQDNKLGSGAFGEVYKGILSDGSIVGVKRLFNSNREQLLHEFLSEVVLISGIKHKNLIQMKGCCIKDEERILVYEFAANGNLAEALWGKHKVPFLDWTRRLNVAVGVARGLSYLHEELQPRIIHRDIKAANVLLDDNLNAKIADFGLAKSFAEEETQAQFTAVAGTRGYFAPEYVLEGQLTVKADVFSFGILLLEIVTGRKCIDSSLPSDRVYIKTWAKDLQKSGTLLELLQPELRDTAPELEFMTIINIALLCVRTDPQSRPTMSQVVIMLLRNLEIQNTFEDRGTSEEDDFKVDSLEDGTRTSKYEPTSFIYEDSDEVPFVRSPSFPLSLGTPRTDNAGVLELSSVRGR